jgi:hypothetical protein
MFRIGGNVAILESPCTGNADPRCLVCFIGVVLQGVVRLEEYTGEGAKLAASADLTTVAVIQPHITEFTP